MAIKPMDDRLLVRPSQSEEKTAGGIILPDTAKEKPQEGEVIEVGTDEDLASKVKVGDRVIYTRYGGTEIKVKDETLLILQRSDILAIVR